METRVVAPDTGVRIDRENGGDELGKKEKKKRNI